MEDATIVDSTGSDPELDIESLIVPGWQVGWSTWLLVIGILTLALGNVCNTWIIYTSIRKDLVRQSSFNALVLNNSIQKGLLGYVTWPSLMYWKIVGRLPDSMTEEVLCMTTMFFVSWIATVGMVNNAVVALNRVLACYPSWHLAQKLTTTRATVVMVSVSWAVCLVIFLVPLLAYQEVSKGSVGCLTEHGYELLLREGEKSRRQSETSMTIVTLEFATVTVGTFAGCICCYGIIIRHLFNPTMQLSSQRRRDRKRALLVIVAVFLIFLISWAPPVFVLLREPEGTRRAYAFLTYLPMFEGLASPLLYVGSVPALRPKWMARRYMAVGVFTQSIDREDSLKRTNTVKVTSNQATRQ